MANIHTFKFTLETLSPVFIGAGNDHDLSPYADFVQEDQMISLIDMHKMEKALVNDQQLMDQYVRGVRAMYNTRSQFDLLQFIRRELKYRVDDLTKAKIPIIGKVGKNHIRKCITNGDLPYIPGSSLKGMIASSLYFCWLTESEQGQSQRDEIIKRTNTAWEKHKTTFLRAENLLSTDDRNDLDEAKRILTSIKRDFSDSIHNFKENVLFGDLYSEDGPSMRHLRVTDSDCLPIDSISVFPIHRIKLSDFGDATIPTWCIAIRPGNKTTFSININPVINNAYLGLLNDKSPEKLINCINRFAEASYKYEINRIEKLDEDKFIDAIFEFYADLEESDVHAYKAGENKTSTIFRIGFGKSFFDNSIGLAIHEKVPDLLDKYRKMLGLGQNPKKKVFSKDFPSTRSLLVANKQATLPLGWCKLRVIT